MGQLERDREFLVLLVHHGHLERADAEQLLPRLAAGESLDDLLEEVVGWEPRLVAKMRRTNAGEIPEIPGYQIVGKIGTGGTADVFRAREKESGRALALKVLKPRATAEPATLRSFIEEAKLLQRLDHPGLVKGYGVARSGKVYFNRMELVSGRTALEWLDDGREFSEEEALRIALELAEVMCFLEEQCVVHRDVKPGNVMLTESGSLKLIDLGFAQQGDSGQAGQVAEHAESTVGTVAYLSPEQARGSSADSRSDIYSLGVSLFHIVVGRLPFDSSDDREVLRMQVMESLSSPELRKRGISPHLHYFIERMMAKEAEHRFQNWAELIREVREQLEGRESLDFEADARAAHTRSPRRRRR